MPSGQPRAVVSLNRSKSALRSFFRFLTDAGHVKQNPARLVRSAPCHQKPPSCLSLDEARRLLATIRKDKTPLAERDHPMFSLMLSAGIRLGSVVGLNVGDVELAVGTIRVNGKGNVEQLVFLNGGLKRPLKKHIAGRHTTEPLFLSARGKRIGPRQVQLRLKYWLKKAGISRRCTVHSLRHTFAQRLYVNTGDLRLVQRALGHRQVTTTEIYSHVVDQELRRAMKSAAPDR
jgi:integrase/recombinase XerC